MEFQYYLVYLIVNIVCIVFALTIFSRLNRNIGSDTENKIFRMMLAMYIAFLLCEVIWVLGVGGFVPIPPRGATTLKLLSTVFIPIMVYFWLQFAEMSFENPRAYTRPFRLVTFIPVGIMLLIYISTPFTGLVAKVLEDGTMVEGPMIALTGVVDNLYGIAVIVHALILMAKNRGNLMKRRVYVTHILFIVICTLGGMADAVIKGTPIMPLAIMLSYNVLFINLQESKIFNDSLTGLNNRRRAERYLRELIAGTNERNPFCLIMIDIDDFSEINEKYGHMGGDRALTIVGDGLKETAEKRNGFAARWSGVDFMAVLRTGDIKEVEDFENDLSQAIDRGARLQALPYKLNISIGQEMCDRNDRSLMDVVDSADRKLYEAKAASGLADQ